MLENKMEYVIAPPKRWVSVNWPELWRYRDLFLVLAWRDISVRYKQTVLGFIWAIFQPLVNMVIFSFIFNRMAKIESGDGTPYPIFLYVGQLFWIYCSGTLSNAAISMVSAQAFAHCVSKYSVLIHNFRAFAKGVTIIYCKVDEICKKIS